MVEIVMVAAVGANGVIGRSGGLPWRLPSDLKHFRALTLGRPLIMGRSTFEGIGRPLPGRTTIVLTRDAAWHHDGVETAASLDDALARGRTIADRDGVGEVIIAGGAAVYGAALARADRIELTEVALAPDGDAVFPKLDHGEWREVARSGAIRAEGDEAAMVFVTLTRLDG
jgi:dihydrofolate reductase